MLTIIILSNNGHTERASERERERERARKRERESRERHARTLFRCLPRLQQRRSAGGPCSTGKTPLEETTFERAYDQLRALQKDPYNIEFARSVREMRGNKSTRMSSSSEHNIIDSLLAFEAIATHKKPSTAEAHATIGALRTSKSSTGKTPLEETPLDCARVRQDAQRISTNVYKSRPAAQWQMAALNVI